MPFGLTNSPATFQRLIKPILRPVLGIELVIKTDIHIDEDEGMLVVAYIADIIISNKGSVEKDQRQLGKGFDSLLENQMCIDIDKCVFEQTEAVFLGLIVNGKSIRMDPAKAHDIVDWPKPKNQKEVQQVLGLWNIYTRFIPNYAQRVAPIMDILRGDGKDFHFAEAQEAASLKMVVLLTSGKTPILRHFDQDRPAIIETDASHCAIGAVLSQKFEDGKIHPCSFSSRKLSPAEFNYDVFDKKMLAIVDALQKWRHYALGTPHIITIFSDHQNLEYFTTKVNLNRRQARWAEILQEYSSLVYIEKDL